MLYFLFFIIPHVFFANQLNIPKLPTIQEPSINTPEAPKLPHIDIHTHISKTQSSVGYKTHSIVLQNLIDEVTQKNMDLNTSCLPQKISIQKLNYNDVERIGIHLKLSTTQYKDNIFRLKNITLKPVNEDIQKQFESNSYVLSDVLMVMTFLEKGIKRHIITLSSDYIQVDNALLENTPQIFKIFKTYFCNLDIFD